MLAIAIIVCVCVCARARVVLFDSLRPHGLQPAKIHGIFQARILEWVAIF